MLANIDSESDGHDLQRMHIVVVNKEEQYSIWLADRQIPNGWTQCDEPATKEECLAYINRVWTDMRPRSARQPS